MNENHLGTQFAEKFLLLAMLEKVHGWSTPFYLGRSNVVVVLGEF